MAEFSSTIRIAAPIDAVWRVLSKFEEWPQWTPTVTKIASLSAPQSGVGAKFKLEQPKLRPAVWEITDWQAGKSFSWVSRAPGALTVARHDLEAISESETRLTLSLRFSGPMGALVALLSASMVKQYLSLEANGIKTRSES